MQAVQLQNNSKEVLIDTLTTQRLILKRVMQDDYTIYQQILSDQELTKYLPKGRAYTPKEIKFHFNNRLQHWQKYGFGSYVIFDKNKPTHAIGYVGVEVCPNPNYSDIRYAILPQAQGKGYIFEASQKVLSATFTLGKHQQIFGVSLANNYASVHLLKKLGMQPETINPYAEEGDEDGLDKELVVFSINKIEK